MIAKKEKTSDDADSLANENDVDNTSASSNSDDVDLLPGADAYDVNSSDDVENRSETADRNEVDFETFGCSFPEEVKNAAGDLGLTSFGLGWGGTSPPQVGEVELKNLKLTDCEWFKEGDADEFMLVFSDNKQSYAEPFNESLALQGKFGNRGNTNACQSAASSLTAAINQQGIEGVVECSTLPK